MKESDMQTMFGKWLKANKDKHMSAAYELKIEKTNRFNLKKVAWHQVKNLQLSNDGFIYHKIPDMGIQNPYDCLTLYKVPSYVVIMFYKPHKTKTFSAININTFQGLLDDGYKSITEDDAKKFADFRGILK